MRARLRIFRRQSKPTRKELDFRAWFGQAFTVDITVPDQIAAKFSPEDLALNLALGLFVSDKVTLGQAAEVANLSQSAFLKELGKRKIPIHYGVEDFKQDLETIRQLQNL